MRLAWNFDLLTRWNSIHSSNETRECKVKIFKSFALGLAPVGLWGLSTDAFAGLSAPTNIVVTYAPVSTSSIPSLSEWTLVAMVALIGVIAYRFLRERSGGRPVAAIVLAGSLAASAFWGQSLTSRAIADSAYDMSVPTGGTVTVGACVASATLPNNSGAIQQIISVSPGVGESVQTVGGTCTPNLVVPNTQSCTVTQTCSYVD